jgi:hypothetical protein
MMHTHESTKEKMVQPTGSIALGSSASSTHDGMAQDACEHADFMMTPEASAHLRAMAPSGDATNKEVLAMKLQKFCDRRGNHAPHVRKAHAPAIMAIAEHCASRDPSLSDKDRESGAVDDRHMEAAIKAYDKALKDKMGF